MAGEVRLSIRSLDAMALCEKYDATMEDFERILSIETVAFPILQEKWAREAPKKEGAGA